MGKRFLLLIVGAGILFHFFSGGLGFFLALVLAIVLFRKEIV